MVLEVDSLWKLIGIVSAAVGKFSIVNGKNESICNLDQYFTFTDVSKFNNWIEQVVIETAI
jgi:hypothetical protein